MIIDTDVLIWYLRGSENARKIIHANIPFKISVISYLELIRGIQDERELVILKNHLKKWAAEIIQINKDISSRAMFLVEDFHVSRSLEFGDAIIAATALENHETLLTANHKKYGFIPNIQIHKCRPGE